MTPMHHQHFRQIELKQNNRNANNNKIDKIINLMNKQEDSN